MALNGQNISHKPQKTHCFGSISMLTLIVEVKKTSLTVKTEKAVGFLFVLFFLFYFWVPSSNWWFWVWWRRVGHSYAEVFACCFSFPSWLLMCWPVHFYCSFQAFWACVDAAAAFAALIWVYEYWRLSSIMVR